MVEAVTARSKIGKATNPLDTIPAVVSKATAGFQSGLKARIVKEGVAVHPSMLD